MHTGQSEIILEHMLRGNRISPMSALRLCGSWALSSRICDLKKQGYQIKSELVKRNGKMFKEYFIEKS
jgi:hypothetical protein